MKLIAWNVNGLRSVAQKGKLAELVEFHSPDMLCLQESKVQKDQIIPIPGYQHAASCALKKGYSGVVTYFKDEWRTRVEVVAHGIGHEKFDSEGRFVILSLNNLELYNIYIPSGTTGELRQNFKYDFLEKFYQHLAELPARRRNNLVITGDFNICHKPIDIHHPATAEKLQLSGFLPEERAWMDRFVDSGFVDVFRQVNGLTEKAYTWWTFRAGARQKNLGWRIDYFFAAQGLASRILRSQILADFTGSDHCPILMELDA